MGAADRYADGQWNFYCDLCGKKGKSSEGRKTWDGFYVCSHHKEVRNPQDFVKGVREVQSVPWTRAGAADAFLPGAAEVLRDSFGDPILDTVGSAVMAVGD